MKTMCCLAARSPRACVGFLQFSTFPHRQNIYIRLPWPRHYVQSGVGPRGLYISCPMIPWDGVKAENQCYRVHCLLCDKHKDSSSSSSSIKMHSQVPKFATDWSNINRDWVERMSFCRCHWSTNFGTQPKMLGSSMISLHLLYQELHYHPPKMACQGTSARFSHISTNSICRINILSFFPKFHLFSPLHWHWSQELHCVLEWVDGEVLGEQGCRETRAN